MIVSVGNSMDSESHIQVLNSILYNLSDKTVIIATHNLEGIELFERVFVMSDGHLVESGAPTNLLRDESSRLYAFAVGDRKQTRNVI